MSENEVLQNLRVNYQSKTLDIDDCHQDPFIQFNLWLSQSISSECDEPNAFTLSTAKNNIPRSRVVLLKGIHEGQLVFYTNFDSDKGKEIVHNEHVAMNFLWLPLHRQVRIEGIVSKVSNSLSDDYFLKRPRGSQLGAIASPQSQIVESRKHLEDIFNLTESKFLNIEKIPRPSNWGGYGVTPHYFEFWQGRPNRLHDRICLKKDLNGWTAYRLAP